MSVRKPLIFLLIFAAASMLITTIVVLTIVNPDVGPQTSYRAQFTDVSGLRVGDIVRMAGVEVGKVSAEEITGTQAVLTFSVDSSVPVTDTTQAVIRYQNVIGQRFLSLVRGSTDGHPLAPNTLIPTSRTQPALDLTVLFNGFKPLFAALTPDQVNQLAGELVSVLQGEGGTIDSLLQQTASITGNLADRDSVIDSVVDNLSGLLGTVAGRDQQLGQLVDQLASLTSTLAADRGSIGTSLGQIDALASSFSGLLQGSRPAFDHDVSSLLTLSGTLVSNEGGIDAALNGLPTLLSALDRVLSYGSWANLYVCSLTVHTQGQASLGVVPLPITLPQGPVGNQSVHSAACS